MRCLVLVMLLLGSAQAAEPEPAEREVLQRPWQQGATEVFEATSRRFPDHPLMVRAQGLRNPRAQGSVAFHVQGAVLVDGGFALKLDDAEVCLTRGGGGFAVAHFRGDARVHYEPPAGLESRALEARLGRTELKNLPVRVGEIATDDPAAIEQIITSPRLEPSPWFCPSVERPRRPSPQRELDPFRDEQAALLAPAAGSTTAAEAINNQLLVQLSLAPEEPGGPSPIRLRTLTYGGLREGPFAPEDTSRLTGLVLTSETAPGRHVVLATHPRERDAEPQQSNVDLLRAELRIDLEEAPAGQLELNQTASLELTPRARAIGAVLLSRQRVQAPSGTFEAGPSVVTGVRVDGADTPFVETGTAVVIALGREVSPGETVTVEVDVTSRYAPSQSATTELLMPQGAWVPLPQHRDIFGLSATVCAPDRGRLIGSGITEETWVEGGRRCERWSQVGVGASFGMAWGDLESEERTGVDGERLRLHWLRGSEPNRRPTMDEAEAARDFVRRRLGPLPFPELDLLALHKDLVPRHLAGYSQPGFAVISGERDHGSGMARVTAHEIGHQYWGAGVTMHGLTGAWLTEAVPSLLAWDWVAEHHGDDAAAATRRQAIRYAATCAGGWPLSLAWRSPCWKESAYARGPMTLVELREEVGHVPFNTFLRVLTHVAMGKELTPEIVQFAVARQLGGEAALFFERWVDAPDIPTVRVKVELRGTRLSSTLRVQGEMPDVPLTIQMRGNAEGSEAQWFDVSVANQLGGSGGVTVPKGVAVSVSPDPRSLSLVRRLRPDPEAE